MIYSKHQLGLELKEIVSKSYDIIKISRWAERIYIDHCRELSPELDDIIMALSVMEYGPEFEYTEKELKLLSELLIKEAMNPLKQIDQIKNQ